MCVYSKLTTSLSLYSSSKDLPELESGCGMSLALMLCALTNSLADPADMSSFFFILSRRENILASASELVEVRDLRSRLVGEDV